MARINTLRRRMAQITLLLSFMLVFAVSVSAYTLVLRGGRRIEIPSTFVVTKNTLTYEVSPGIQMTFALAAIDIAATEKVNNQQPGSLLQRAQLEVTRPVASTAGAPGRRTITNRDLEASMRRRLESEAAYEIKRKQLGLPTLEESRKRAAAIPDVMGTELEKKLIADRESEIYWRDRAEALRAEMATLDAELRYIRARIDEVSFSTSGSSFSTTTILPFISFGNVGFGHSSPGFSRGQGIHRVNRFVAPGTGAQITGRVSFGGGATRGQVFLNPRRLPRRMPFGAGRHGSFPAVGNYGVIGFAGQPYDLAYERNALITQFNELAAARAGLNARWRELEDEARRAGAYPGWLRP